MKELIERFGGVGLPRMFFVELGERFGLESVIPFHFAPPPTCADSCP